MKLLQLTIRDLFWLTALVAVCAAWFMDRSRLVQQVQRTEAKLFWSPMHGQLPRNDSAVLINQDYP
jgi:hypothetical protein